MLCAEPSVAAQWRGVAGLSAVAVAGVTNDYERACETVEVVESMVCGRGSVLILGDEPADSAFFRTKGGQVAIARWIYAPSLEAAEVLLAEGPATVAELAPPLDFEVKEGSLALFDSAAAGAEVLPDSAKLTLPVGRYRVTVEQWESEDCCFFVHRLIPLADEGQGDW